jgi:hypothetical protein
VAAATIRPRRPSIGVKDAAALYASVMNEEKRVGPTLDA